MENVREANDEGLNNERVQDEIRNAISKNLQIFGEPCSRSDMLNALRLRGLLCDATVYTENGPFAVHRNVLSASSTYFRAQFIDFDLRDTPQRSGPQKVYIHGISGIIFSELLDYAYLEKCNINSGNAYAILVAADFTGMMSLRSECIKFLENLLTPKNCVKMVKYAKFRNLDTLYSAALDYVLGHFPEVCNINQDILDIPADELFDILNNDRLNTKDEDSVWHLILRWIERDPKNRQPHVARLLLAVRTGLMSPECFEIELRKNSYVLSSPEAVEYCIKGFDFSYDSDLINSNEPLITPYLAIPRLPHEVVFTIGGWNSRARSTIEAYDSRADIWTIIDAEDPIGPFCYHGSVAIGTNIYIIGGFDGQLTMNTCRVFDTVTKVWNEIAPMHFSRAYLGCCELNGFIYAIGGFDGRVRLNSVERYNPRTNQWTMMGALSESRSDGTACTLNGRIFYAGGFNGEEFFNIVEYYDPETNVWTPITNMNTRRAGARSIGYRDSLYVFGGGYGDDRLSSCERFDFGTYTWQPIKDMRQKRSNFGLVEIDDRIYVCGGFSGTFSIPDTEFYDVDADQWILACDMCIARSAVTATVVSNIPNVGDYVSRDRMRLMETRRLRLVIEANARAVVESNVSESQSSSENEAMVLDMEEDAQ